MFFFFVISSFNLEYFSVFFITNDSDSILSKSYDFLTISIIYGLTNSKSADIILNITVTKL
ncbi:hypothetical protein J45TS6_00490 [Paenibacillus sp. J45TS6]|nr:hypothetical protein J45TS6_00490 [Paenibacillus sp. J45TS6]